MPSRAGRKAIKAVARSFAETTGKWRVFLCAGDALKQAETLEQTGIVAAEAEALAAKLAAAEKTVPAERLALFASFKGLVEMDAGDKQ